MKKFIGLFFVCFCVCNLFSLELYKTNVIASFYAEDFHGKKTSNGERFNMYDLTCAHKSLPFNTILKAWYLMQYPKTTALFLSFDTYISA